MDNLFKKPHYPVRCNEEEPTICLSVVENGKTNFMSISENTEVGRETEKNFAQK